MKVIKQQHGTFDASEIRPMSDEECLASPETMKNLRLTYAMLVAEGLDLRGTQIDRVVKRWERENGEVQA